MIDIKGYVAVVNQSKVCIVSASRQHGVMIRHHTNARHAWQARASRIKGCCFVQNGQQYSCTTKRRLYCHVIGWDTNSLALSNIDANPYHTIPSHVICRQCRSNVFFLVFLKEKRIASSENIMIILVPYRKCKKYSTMFYA